MSTVSPDIPRRFWPYALGIALVFLLRGVFVLALLPPLEGWDEYQHLSYVVHLDEFGERPDANSDTISATLFPALRKYPQPWWGVANTTAIGGHGYRKHWQSHDQPVDNQRGEDVLIYQAQHGTLAYWALLPVYRISGGLKDPLRTIFFMRFANVVLGAIAVFLVAMTI